MTEQSYVIIEGPIGSGKSTLTTELVAMLNNLLLERGSSKKALGISEPDEKTNNPFLPWFYKISKKGKPTGAKRWGAWMQGHLLHERYGAHELCQWWCINEQGPAVMDRSYYGDTCFAKMLFTSGLINEEEFWAYCRMFHKMQTKVARPDIMIRLTLDPEEAVRRVIKRAERDQKSRKIEKGLVTVEYNKALDNNISIMSGVMSRLGVEVINEHHDMDRDTPEQREQSVKSLAKRILDFQPPDFFTGLYERPA